MSNVKFEDYLAKRLEDPAFAKGYYEEKAKLEDEVKLKMAPNDQKLVKTM
ncbi:MAG: hypothetical protein LBN08_02285 [Lactobacillales bacterium]|jgi:hypothetical protein|nr:hypothetical protein [Lactobacillales bacterium]